jgi:hypothetical protein
MMPMLILRDAAMLISHADAYALCFITFDDADDA